MARRVQLIRHATGAADAFVGLQGEISVDTTTKELRVHDGLSAGGIQVARQDLVNVAGATTAVDGKLVAADKQKLEWLGLTQDVDLDNLEAEVAIALADIIAIETKTDFITVTQAVNLDTMESNIATLDTDLGVAEAKLATIESGATADQTDAEIRTAVEAATDSNVFTDADHTKLNGIETGATADQSNAEIRAATAAATDSNVFTDALQTKVDDDLGVTNIKLNTKVIDIGDWNMDATSGAGVTHGLTLSKIRSVSALIRNDADTIYYPLSGSGTALVGDVQMVIEGITATLVSLSRQTGGNFDNTAFDSTSYNRGWITIQYTD